MAMVALVNSVVVLYDVTCLVFSYLFMFSGLPC